MAEYISREAVMDALLHEQYGYLCEDAIKSIPAADVRPVVLCRDCKYYYKDADGYEMCENSEGYDHVMENGFCAWAKKREES